MKAEDSIKFEALTKELADYKRRCDNQTSMLSIMAGESIEKDRTIESLKGVDSCACIGWKIATGLLIAYELFKFLIG